MIGFKRALLAVVVTSMWDAALAQNRSVRHLTLEEALDIAPPGRDTKTALHAVNWRRQKASI